MGDTLKMKECDTMRILVVEDDRLLNNTLCYNLNTAGYTVDSALTKSVASSFLTKQDYDLIVLDVNLPDGNGFDFCREIKERRPNTVIIFLTANDMELGIETTVNGEILEHGKIALDAKLFSEITRRVSSQNAVVTIESDDKFNTTISCENSVFNIQVRDG